MRKLKYFFIITFLLYGALTVNAQSMIQELPKKPLYFISYLFLDFEIESISILENESYEVKLSNGAVISFDINGNWRKINSPIVPIPAKVIPKEIFYSINQEFKNPKIIYVNKTKGIYETVLYDKYDICTMRIKESGEIIYREIKELDESEGAI